MPKVSDAHLQARRRQILDAAATCFARDGFHRTSMQDIVRESGISSGLVYRYFAGKDDVITAIVAEWHERRRALLDSTDVSQLAVAYLDLLRAVGTSSAIEDGRLGVQVWAEALRSPRIRELVRAGVDGPRATLGHLIGDGDALVRVLIAVYQGLVLQTALDDTVDNEAFVRTVARIVDALLAP